MTALRHARFGWSGRKNVNDKQKTGISEGKTILRPCRVTIHTPGTKPVVYRQLTLIFCIYESTRSMAVLWVIFGVIFWCQSDNYLFTSLRAATNLRQQGPRILCIAYVIACHQLGPLFCTIQEKRKLDALLWQYSQLRSLLGVEITHSYSA